MTSRSPRRGGAVASTLGGLVVTAGIAREGVDAVPIAKEVLGVVGKILAYAEQIERDREALHALADKSEQLAKRLNEVLGNEEPDPMLLPSIDRLRSAFYDVEKFMAKHTSRTSFLRGLSYALTAKTHVDRLSRSMENALQEILTVAAFAVIHQAKNTQLAIAADAQYDGKFALIRDCEVDKLDQLWVEKDDTDSRSSVVRYHSARIREKLVVVRYCEGPGLPDPDAIQPSEEALYARMEYNDSILRDLSTVQASHRNVAKIYGRSEGPIHSRFTAFKSGTRPVDSHVFNGAPEPVTAIVECAFKLLVEGYMALVFRHLKHDQDAVSHLRLMGISWDPTDPPYVVDDKLEPTIGLRNDLRRFDSERDSEGAIDFQASSSLIPIWNFSSREMMTLVDFKKTVPDYRLETIIDLFGPSAEVIRRHWAIPKILRQKLDADIAKSLLRVVDEEVVGSGWRARSWIWASILLALDENCSHRLKTGLKVFYHAHSLNSGPDWLEVHGLDANPERVVYDRYLFKLPDDQREEFMEMFGITVPAEDEGVISTLIAADEPGTYRAPE